MRCAQSNLRGFRCDDTNDNASQPFDDRANATENPSDTRLTCPTYLPQVGWRYGGFNHPVVSVVGAQVQMQSDNADSRCRKIGLGPHTCSIKMRSISFSTFILALFRLLDRWRRIFMHGNGRLTQWQRKLLFWASREGKKNWWDASIHFWREIISL